MFNDLQIFVDLGAQPSTMALFIASQQMRLPYQFRARIPL